MYNVNNDYSYLSRMVQARRKEEADYENLRKTEIRNLFCAGLWIFDAIIFIIGVMIYYA